MPLARKALGVVLNILLYEVNKAQKRQNPFYVLKINSNFLSNPSRPLVLGRLIIIPNKNNLMN